MTQTTDNKQLPLWKVLNGMRYRGPWKITQKELADGTHVYLTTDQDLPIIDCGMAGEGLCKTSAQYTALSVNNLANLAETLERIEKIEDAAFSLPGFDVTRLKEEIRTALARIS